MDTTKSLKEIVDTLLVLKPQVLWLYYAEKPSNSLPRKWKGLVNYGRLDIVARLLLASLYPTGKLEENSSSILFLDEGDGEGDCVLFTRRCLPSSMSYEHDSAKLLLDSLKGQGCPVFKHVNLFALIRRLRNMYKVVFLAESGSSMKTIEGGKNYLFIIGTRVDPPGVLAELSDKIVRVGCRSYLASTVAAYINTILYSLRRLE